MVWNVFKDRNGRKMGVHGVNSNGEPTTLLNPHGKGAKYALELKHGRAVTNDMHRKYDENGKPVHLRDTQKAWRSGYLQARADSAKTYNARKAKRANKAK